MATDYEAKWVVANNPPFLFHDPYGIEYFGDPDRMSFHIPKSDQLAEGEASGDGLPEPRNLIIGGLLEGADEEEFAERMDVLTRSVRGGIEGRLYKNSERYLNCRQVYFERGRDQGLTHCEWEMVFRASDPFYYSEEVFSQELNTSGNTALSDIGGTYDAIPVIVLTVSNVGATPSPPFYADGGKITLTWGEGGVETSFSLRPSATGSYTVDSVKGAVLMGSTDKVRDFSGAFVEGIGPGTAIVNIQSINGAAISYATIQWRRRYVAST